MKGSSHSTQSNAVAAVKDSTKDSSPVIACVSKNCKKIVCNNSVVKVVEINDVACNSLALVDTGSPISFISASAFKKFFNSIPVLLEKSFKSYKALNDFPIAISGFFASFIKLEAFPYFSASITLHVLQNDFFSADIILGRDFLSKHEISIAVKSDRDETKNRLELFSEVASANILDNPSNNLKDFLAEVEIDFDSDAKQNLIATIIEVENTKVTPVHDDFSVKIALKDESIYAYAPRRFAWT